MTAHAVVISVLLCTSQVLEEEEIYELRVRLRELITEFLLTDEGKANMAVERDRRIAHADDARVKQMTRVRRKPRTHCTNVRVSTTGELFVLAYAHVGLLTTALCMCVPTLSVGRRPNCATGCSKVAA